ncbi:hypothetical protein JOF53_005536 [Crossiella equi]|uniref:CHAT domain-containing protein n=1 Tax=Crossiella equi TaxID=130796 RepID=A0ABS5AKC5_9PSEU|nr:CHAT domain-containing protein [Crossiella equi]MBP2476664.1 hypothetical protein [Crossiella equi]
MTVQLTYVDLGDLYLTWRWEHDPASPRVVVLPRDRVDPPLRDLAAALPTPLPGETAYQALARALTGAYTDRAREAELSGRLAEALLPAQLSAELNEVLLSGRSLHLRVQPSPSTAQVPWEALRVDTAERLVHNAIASVLVPATVRGAPTRHVPPYRPDGPVAAALDPVTPLGPVLGEPTPALAALRVELGPPVDRTALPGALATASRFLYAGHVTTSAHALDARLHLADGPVAAADLLATRCPSRVALIACESGGEHRYAEPSGLVAAFVHGGAEHVTATRWVLPTDEGLARLLPGFARPPEGVLPAAVLAVHAAHGAHDPVAAVNAWQRDQADRWQTTGDPALTPLLWAAFGTTWAPPPG